MLSKRTQRAFTLVELVVVMIVVVILAAVAFSRLDTVDSTANTQALRFIQDIRYTQSLAETHGQHYALVLTSNQTYQIVDSSSTPVPAVDTGATSFTLKAGMTYTTNLPNQLIAFDSAGTPYADLAGTQPLTTAGEITLLGGTANHVLTITPETGWVFAS